MPSRGFGDAHAVTRTTESPMRTTTDPSACFAYLPVSKEREVPLTSSSRLYICASELIGDWGIGDWAMGISRLPYQIANRLSPNLQLFADAQAADQFGVALGVFALQVIQQAPALADQLEETASRVMIFRVRLEVLGEIADAFAENGDLNFRRAGVGFVCAVRRDELGLTVLIECHECFPPRAVQLSLSSPIRRNALIPNE